GGRGGAVPHRAGSAQQRAEARAGEERAHQRFRHRRRTGSRRPRRRARLRPARRAPRALGHDHDARASRGGGGPAARRRHARAGHAHPRPGSTLAMPIRILIADDHGVVAEGLKQLVEAESDMQVVALVGDGREAVQQARDTQPDVVLMDLSMPELNGADATRAILQRDPKCRVIVLSMYAQREYVRRALKAGAAGYVVKRSAAKEVVEAIRAVHAGQRYFSPRAAPARRSPSACRCRRRRWRPTARAWWRSSASATWRASCASPSSAGW